MKKAGLSQAKKPPKSVKGWACGSCGRRYIYKNDPNLARCCLCCDCGKYLGVVYGCRRCDQCRLKADIEYNKKTLESVQKTLVQQEAQYEKLYGLSQVRKDH